MNNYWAFIRRSSTECSWAATAWTLKWSCLRDMGKPLFSIRFSKAFLWPFIMCKILIIHPLLLLAQKFMILVEMQKNVIQKAFFTHRVSYTLSQNWRKKKSNYLTEHRPGGIKCRRDTLYWSKVQRWENTGLCEALLEEGSQSFAPPPLPPRWAPKQNF